MVCRGIVIIIDLVLFFIVNLISHLCRDFLFFILCSLLKLIVSLHCLEIIYNFHKEWTISFQLIIFLGFIQRLL